MTFDNDDPTFLRRHLKKVIFLGLLLCAAGAFLAFKPVKTVYRSFKAAKLVEVAQAHLDAEEWQEAQDTALQAIQNEKSVEAIRILAEAMKNTNNAGTLQAHYRLFGKEKATFDDRYKAIKIGLDQGDLKAIGELIKLLPKEDQKDPAMHYQVVHYKIRTGQFEEAIELADDLTITPRDPGLDLLVAKGLVASGMDGAREATTSRLIAIMNGEDREAALAT